MSTRNTHSFIPNGKGQSEDNQLKKVLTALYVKPMTMKELDVYTGIMRENICRHIKTLLDTNKVAVIKKRKCTITGHNNVNEYSTNPDLFPQSNQLDIPFGH